MLKNKAEIKKRVLPNNSKYNKNESNKKCTSVYKFQTAAKKTR